MIRWNVVKKPAPSIRAASSRSRGIDAKYCRSRKMLEPPIARTITRPMYWPKPFVNPIPLRIR